MLSIVSEKDGRYSFSGFGDGDTGGGGVDNDDNDDEGGVQEEGDGGVAFGCVGARRSLSYYKLPKQLFRLSVLKLDGSSFDVQVARTASILELKQAVEEVFSQSPKEGEGKISWSHVWSHFCLCYEGSKLVNDKASLRTFGINDGDQLHFIKHLSIYQNRAKKFRSRNHSAARKEHTTRPSIGPDYAGRQDEDEKMKGGLDSHNENDDNNDDDDDENMTGGAMFKLAHFLKGWLSYSRLWFVGRVRSHGSNRPLRLGSFHNLKAWEFS